MCRNKRDSITKGRHSLTPTVTALTAAIIWEVGTTPVNWWLFDTTGHFDTIDRCHNAHVLCFAIIPRGEETMSASPSLDAPEGSGGNLRLSRLIPPNSESILHLVPPPRSPPSLEDTPLGDAFNKVCEFLSTGKRQPPL